MLWKQFIAYAVRWQLSSPVLALALYYLQPHGIITATIAANLIGAMIFFWIDKRIFKQVKIT